MNMKSTLPTANRERLPIARESEWPVHSLQRAVNRIFQDFFTGIEPYSYPSIFTEELSKFNPRLDFSETEKEYLVSAELPGMELKDIDVSIAKGMLTIKGEKKEEKEEKLKGRYHMERSYGSFYRTLALPTEIDADKTEAKFKNGVLSIKLPKAELVQEQVKKLSVKAG